MKTNSTLPNKKSVISMVNNFKKLMSVLEIIQPHIDKARMILENKDKKLDFIAFDYKLNLKSKEFFELFDFTIANVVFKNGKEFYLKAPKMSHSLENCTETLPIINKLEKLYNIEYTDLEISKQKEILKQRKEIWEAYKFQFGGIAKTIDYFQLQENEIIMASELAHEIKHLQKIIKVIEKYNQKKLKNGKNQLLITK